MRRLTAVVVALAAAAVTLAYVVPLRGYGLTLQDEGTLLYQIARVARGELPYVDFSTGYTPGYFAVNAALWRAVGNVVHLRIALALVHALTVAGLALAIGRVARPLLAFAVPLLYVAFIPVFPGEFCAFNVPYPAWYATLGWIATAAAMLAWRDRQHRRWLVLAGTYAAATLAIKPNAGLFAIAAAATVLLVGVPPVAEGEGAPSDADAAPRRARALMVALAWWALWAGVLAGVAVTFGARLRPFDALVYLAPLAALLLVLAFRRRPQAHARLWGDAIALLAPFALLTAPWMVFFYRALGPAGFVREVLLIGTGSEEIFYVPYPAFTSWGLLATAALVAFAILGLLVARRVVSAAIAMTVACAAALAGAAAVAALGVMPEGLVVSIVWQLESAAFAVVLLAHVAGVAWLARAGAASLGTATVTLLVFALFMHLQLYPRTDFMHLLIAAPLTAAFASALLERVLRWWERDASAAERPAASGARRRSLATVVAAIVLALLIGVGASRALGLLVAGPWVALPFPVAPLAIEEAYVEDHRDLAAAGVALAERVPPGQPSLGFPALDMLLFLTGARNPAAHGYFFPGRPDHREEAEVLDALVAAQAPALASQNARFAFFDGAPPYYFLLRRYVRRAYSLAERHGRFDVLARVLDRAEERTDEEPPAAPIAHDLSVLGDADPVRRQQALASVLARVVASGEGRGLEDELAGTPLDTRTTVLLVRTIRDTRDPRAASYLFATLDDARPRVRQAVLEAMTTTRAQLVARRYLWAGPLRPRVWPARAALRQRMRATLADAAAPAAARAFAAYLAGELADAESVPVLRHILDGVVQQQRTVAASATPGHDALIGGGAAPVRQGDDVASLALSDAMETAASAAASLVALTPRDLACALTELLRTPAPELHTLIPSLLLELADRQETAPEARWCLQAALRRVDGGREQAVWIAAALVDPAFEPLLRDALATGSVGVRRAAAWALGESLPADGTDTALATAQEDVDPLVRSLAARALDKRHGQAPRAFGASMPRSA